jgi:hypothetical protein
MKMRRVVIIGEYLDFQAPDPREGWHLRRAPVNIVHLVHFVQM